MPVPAPNLAAAESGLPARHVATVGLLGLLLGLQPVTTDLYLPALPALTQALSASMAQAQLTLSVLLLSFGVSQLLLGPVSDRFGRRPVLQWGLGLYALASLGGAFAQHVEWLLPWRALQGVGMGAAVVCGRAVVRDLYTPLQGMRVMSQALSVLGILALTSPVLGGLLAAGAGWRAALAAPAVFAALTLAWLWRALPESLSATNPKALHWGTMWRTWLLIGRHPGFVAWCALVSCTYGGLYTFLAGSSFVFIDVLKVPRPSYGLMLATSSLAYLAGTFLCRRWLHFFGPVVAVKRAAFFSLAGGLCMAGSAAAGWHSPWALLLGQWLFAFGHGVHQPCGQAAVTGPFPAQAGAASALAGFVLAAVAFGIGSWLGWAMDGSVKPMAYTLGLFAVLTSLVAWTLVQRHGQPAQH